MWSVSATICRATLSSWINHPLRFDILLFLIATHTHLSLGACTVGGNWHVIFLNFFVSAYSRIHSIVADHNLHLSGHFTDLSLCRVPCFPLCEGTSFQFQFHTYQLSLRYVHNPHRLFIGHWSGDSRGKYSFAEFCLDTHSLHYNTWHI